MDALIIFAKYPTPGKVKTRLGARMGYSLAARLYKVFIDLTLRITATTSIRDIYVAFEPLERAEDFSRLVPETVKLFPQKGRDLGERLINAIEFVLNDGATRIVIIGSDSPTLPPAWIEDALRQLQKVDLVLGPATDGGFYLIGLKQLHYRVFENIEWSSASVLTRTLENVRAMGLPYELLPEWYDLDEMEDLKRAALDDSTGMIKRFLQKNRILES